MWNPREWTRLEANCILEAFKSMCKNMEKHWNPRKSSKIIDEYPTKIIEKSCFEHVSVALSKIMWFSRPERFWSRSGNTLPQAPKFCGFWSENCSDQSKSTKTDAFGTDSPPGSGQKRMQKLRNLWKSVKIFENPRCVPYKNQRKIVFWARFADTLQNNVIFTPGALLVTFRWHFAPSAEILWILIWKLLGSIQIHENERLWKQFAFRKRSEPCAKTAKSVEIRQNRRKSSMSTLQKSTKNRVLSTSRWHFQK